MFVAGFELISARALTMKLPAGIFQTGVETMSGCPQGKARLFFALSPLPPEASKIDDPPKDR